MMTGIQHKQSEPTMIAILDAILISFSLRERLTRRVDLLTFAKYGDVAQSDCDETDEVDTEKEHNGVRPAWFAALGFWY